MSRERFVADFQSILHGTHRSCSSCGEDIIPNAISQMTEISRWKRGRTMAAYSVGNVEIEAHFSADYTRSMSPQTEVTQPVRLGVAELCLSVEDTSHLGRQIRRSIFLLRGPDAFAEPLE